MINFDFKKIDSSVWPILKNYNFRRFSVSVQKSNEFAIFDNTFYKNLMPGFFK